MSSMSKSKRLILYMLLFVCVTGLLSIAFLSSPLDGINKYVIHSIVCIIFICICIFLYISVRLSRDMKNEQYEYDMSFYELLKVIEKKCDDTNRAERIKSDFLASMSHEMRSPLNAMIGFNEMILRKSDDEQIRNYAKDIASSGKALVTLVNDILDYSKVESGRMELKPTKYDLASLINDLSTTADLKAKEKGVKFILNVDDSVPKILFGDEIRLKQIINNLISESIERISEGTITLTINYVRIDDKEINLKVSVKDTGIGMDNSELERIMVPFGQLDKTEKIHIDSLALNMTISQELLTMMGSNLEIRSEISNGSTFFFNVLQRVESWDSIGEFGFGDDSADDEMKSYTPSFCAPKASILVVDDLPVNLSVVTELLADTQVKIDTVSSGQAAIDACREKEYHLILLDHMMPVMNGIETLKKLRADWFNKNRYVPIIALTANAVSGARGMYLKEGFSDYLIKPIDPVEMEKMFVKFLPDELICEPDKVPVINSQKNELVEKLKTVDLLDVESGIKSAGNDNVYKVAVSEFYITIDQTINDIRSSYDANDMDMYIIKVHALKSTARLIGDMELSEMAKELEFAGKNGEMDIIFAKTEPLLTRIIRLKSELSPFFEEEENKDLPFISDSLFREAIDVMIEGAESFDFDMMETVMQQLSEYKLPDTFVDAYKKLKVAMANVDFEEIKAILKNIAI